MDAFSSAPGRIAVEGDGHGVCRSPVWPGCTTYSVWPQGYGYFRYPLIGLASTWPSEKAWNPLVLFGAVLGGRIADGCRISELHFDVCVISLVGGRAGKEHKQSRCSARCALHSSALSPSPGQGAILSGAKNAGRDGQWASLRCTWSNGSRASGIRRASALRLFIQKKGVWLRRYGTITYLGLVLSRQVMQDGCNVVDPGENPLEFISK